MIADESPSLLTVDELLHMAIEAGERERYDLSIAYLKQAQAREARADVLFLLGAHYAQIKMFSDAQHWMQQAVAQDPQFAIASFQLGLLQLMTGDAGAAMQSWQQLDAQPEGHPLRYFRDGLLALNEQALDRAAVALRAGLACEYANAPLMAEMQRVLSNVEQMQQAQPNQAEPVPAAQDGADEHIFLSAYRE